MLNYVTAIFSCQLAGELIVAGTGAPLPGPVVGMTLLLAGLFVWGEVPEELGAVGDFLLSNLSLLFVPAGVGVLLHAPLLAADWRPIAVGLIVSTLATIVVTALVMRALSPAGQNGARQDETRQDDAHQERAE